MNIDDEIKKNYNKWINVIGSNDNKWLSDKSLFNDFLKISKFIDKNWIQNISKEAAWLFLKINELIFFEFLQFSKFYIAKIPDIAFCKLEIVKKDNPKFINFIYGFFVDFCKTYEKENPSPYSMKTFEIFKMTMIWSSLEYEYRISKKSNIELLELLKEIIFQFEIAVENELDEKYTLDGECLLIVISIWKKSCKIEDILKCLSENQKKLIKHFCKFYYSENKNFLSPISKLIENLLIDEFLNDNRLKENPKLYHYTNLESLYSILKYNNLLFSSMDNLNDKDELKLLEYKPGNSLYCFSMTTVEDGIDLFGNYTKMNGISLEIDFEVLTQSLLGLVKGIKNSSSLIGFLVRPFNWNFIQYDNSPKNAISEKTKYLKELFNWLDFDDFLDFSIEKAVESICPFFKKESWKYESEFRIIFNNTLEDIENPVNFKIENNQLFVNINAKKLIKKIIVGPKIKQSYFEMNVLKIILNTFEAEHIEIVSTNANVDLGKLK